MTETPTLAQRLRKCANPSWDPLMNEAAAALEAQAAQIAERDAQIEALRADAERLNWIESEAARLKIEFARSIMGGGFEVGQWRPLKATVVRGDLRAAIDAAMAAKEPK